MLVHAGGFFRFNITGGGQVPVELFYIISGFYMALVLNEKYVGPGSARVFYINRMLCLLPAYWVMAVIALAIYLYTYVATGGGFIAWMADALSEAESWRAAWFFVSNIICLKAEKCSGSAGNADVSGLSEHSTSGLGYALGYAVQGPR